MSSALCAVSTVASAAPANGWVETATGSQVAAGHALARPEQALSPAPLDARLDISIVLRPANPAALRQATAALTAQIAADPALQARAKALATPNAADVQRVTDYLLGKGISDVRVAGNGSLLQASASVGAIQAAFDTAIRSYTANGQTHYVNEGAAKVPAALAGSVVGVLGLDTVRNAAPPRIFPRQLDKADTAAAVSPQATAAATGTVAVMHQVEDLPVLYNAASLPAAADTSAAIIAAGNLENTLVRLASFQAQHRLRANVRVVQVGDPAAAGYRSSDASKQNEVEWDMDTQLLLGNAGGLRTLIIYNVPDFSWKSLIDGVQRAVDDNAARVVSTSIYGPEGSVSQDIYQALNASLNQAVGNGQNFLFCSGDDGIYTPQSASDNPPYYASLLGKPEQRQVGFPASHPYVIAVGATELRTPAGASSTYGSEIAWNAHRGHGITQGGISKLYGAPSWQKTLIPDMVRSGYRAVPDVSFNGSGDSSAFVLQTGSNGNEISGYVYGTSAATPTFAGLLARVLQANGNRIGFVAPALYAYAKNADGKHDVTSGDNGLYGDGYSAAPGWDAVSGWGSVDMLAFSRYLQSH
ncbi:S53 family peptidase [Xanthomonas campestris pv. phormiicola]|nr:S53 family peptidase [Xanthomonas campestris pv. phormiicola]UYC14552.1 S53 family peptidase [Xanthomonas campestris pv. phormiicola]